MEYHGVSKQSLSEAYCKHCNQKIYAVLWDASGTDRNDLDDRIHRHIKSFEHIENYFEYMEYNHNLVAYING